MSTNDSSAAPRGAPGTAPDEMAGSAIVKRSQPGPRKPSMPYLHAGAPARRQAGVNAAPLSRVARETGFSPATKLLIRTRAGLGDPADARCEACGLRLGRYGGQVLRRREMLAGGSGIHSSVVNATLLCGTPLTGHLGLCEARDERLHAMGFWLRSSQSPRGEPIMLHGGVARWLTADGGYGEVA